MSKDARIVMDDEEIVEMAKKVAAATGCYDDDDNSTLSGEFLGQLAIIMAFVVASAPTRAQMEETRENIFEDITRISEDRFGQSFRSEQLS